LPGAQLVYLRGAGHVAHGEQPASYLAVVRAFLQGKQLPIAPYAGDAVPGDYLLERLDSRHGQLA
jgi:hypothetical protein